MNKYLLFLLSLFIVSGCATTRITPKISLGMTKKEVIKLCGEPYKTGATIERGEKLEAFTYQERALYSPQYGLFSPYSFIHIYFIDGKVVQYVGDKDWMTLSDYEGERKIKITTDETIKVEKEQ